MKRGRLYARRSVSEFPNVDLTPLIDIVFCLLIVFMVIAPLLEKEQIQLAAKGGGTAQSISHVAVKIYVGQSGKVKLNGQTLPIDQLGAVLRRQSAKGSAVELYHDRRAAFGVYQTIKNIVEEVGFQELHVVLQST